MVSNPMGKLQSHLGLANTAEPYYSKFPVLRLDEQFLLQGSQYSTAPGEIFIQEGGQHIVPRRAMTVNRIST